MRETPLHPERPDREALGRSRDLCGLLFTSGAHSTGRGLQGRWGDSYKGVGTASSPLRVAGLALQGPRTSFTGQQVWAVGPARTGGSFKATWPVCAPAGARVQAWPGRWVQGGYGVTAGGCGQGVPGCQRFPPSSRGLLRAASTPVDAACGRRAGVESSPHPVPAPRGEPDPQGTPLLPSSATQPKPRAGLSTDFCWSCLFRRLTVSGQGPPCPCG